MFRGTQEEPVEHDDCIYLFNSTLAYLDPFYNPDDYGDYPYRGTKIIQTVPKWHRDMWRDPVSEVTQLGCIRTLASVRAELGLSAEDIELEL